MLLVVDIGNTNITFGLFKGKHLIRKFDIPTRKYRSASIKNILRYGMLRESILCSVVPSMTTRLVSDLKHIIGKKTFVLGSTIRVPLKNLYRKPREVGQDRLVNAYAGVMLFKEPLIIVDVGTAITFDVISRKKEYLGGMILPGLRMSLSALTRDTALLPKVELKNPKEFIGMDTKSSMLSGVVIGCASLIDCLSLRIKEKIGKDAKIIGTGGNIEMIARHSKEFDRIDKDLTLKGLALLYNHNV